VSSRRWLLRCCSMKALRPSNDMQDRDSVMAQPVPRGHRYQFSITRQRKTARYIAYKHNSNLASKVISPAFSFPSYCLYTLHTALCVLTFNGHIKIAEQRIIHYTEIRWLVHWPLMGGCYMWYSDEGPGWAAAPSITHPSTASVPTSYYLMWHSNCLWTLKG